MAEQEKKRSSESRWSHDSGVEVETIVRKKEVGDGDNEMIARGRVFRGKESTPYQATVENRVRHSDSSTSNEADHGNNKNFAMQSLSANLAILRTRPDMAPKQESEIQCKLNQNSSTGVTRSKIFAEGSAVVRDNGNMIPLKIDEKISLDKSITEKFLKLERQTKKVTYNSDSDDSSELSRKRAMLKKTALISKSSSGSSDSLSSPRNSLPKGVNPNFRENKGMFESLASQSLPKKDLGLAFKKNKDVVTSQTRRVSLPETASAEKAKCVQNKASPLSAISIDSDCLPHQRTVHRKHKSEVSSSAMLIRQLTSEPRSGRGFRKTPETKTGQDISSIKQMRTDVDICKSRDMKSGRDLGASKDSKSRQDNGITRDFKSGQVSGMRQDSRISSDLSSRKNLVQKDLVVSKDHKNIREMGFKRAVISSKHDIKKGSKSDCEVTTGRKSGDSSVRRDRFSSRSSSFNADIFDKLKSSFEQPGERPTSPRTTVAIPITSRINDRKALLKKTSSWENKKIVAEPSTRAPAKPMSIGKVSDFVKSLDEKYPDKLLSAPKIKKQTHKSEMGTSNAQGVKSEMHSSDVESDLYEELSSFTETGNEADAESGSEEDIYQCIGENIFIADHGKM